MKHPIFFNLHKDFPTFYEVDKTTECWNWLGGKHERGYGRMRIGGVMFSAHRLSFEMYVAPVPDDLQVCHRCDNPACVNPKHLFLGTQLDNVVDMITKGRARPSKRAGGVPFKLTVDQVLEIKTKAMLGTDYARKFKVSPRTIYNIWTGRTWKWVIKQ